MDVGWAQFLAIIGAGVGAVWVADRQLRAYNDALKASNENERLRNSTKVLDDFNKIIELQGYKFSAFEATSKLGRVASEPSDVIRYKTFPARSAAGDAAAATDARWFTEVSSAGTIAGMYYLDIGMLLDRKLVDFDNVMVKAGPGILMFYDAMTTLGMPLQGSGALGRLATLARSFREGQSTQ